MNISSSRSHAIFSITVETSKMGSDGKQKVKVGRLHLVDLAVSKSCYFVKCVTFFTVMFADDKKSRLRFSFLNALR